MPRRRTKTTRTTTEIAIEAVRQTLNETGQELPEDTRQALYETIVAHLPHGRPSDAQSLGTLGRPAA